ncbi:MAG: hypothetical protein AMJ56_03300 [Anaerolineae bacterium SG8_19]|nr:MAG: hypothetical protein AMJ56_03300 [Anaerolineae bacterium SG8_19]
MVISLKIDMIKALIAYINKNIIEFLHPPDFHPWWCVIGHLNSLDRDITNLKSNENSIQQ